MNSDAPQRSLSLSVTELSLLRSLQMADASVQPRSDIHFWIEESGGGQVIQHPGFPSRTVPVDWPTLRQLERLGLVVFRYVGSRVREIALMSPDSFVSEVPTGRATVFIGHGHNTYWRELKDYVEDVLHLRTVYFEQASHVGEHMVEIFVNSFESVDCAITLLTRDDEQASGKSRARQNVVHETGYFQGRLGFRRVAMVVEREVEEFSNVAGIIPVYFEGRHIRRAFPDIQQWLQREGLVR